MFVFEFMGKVACESLQREDSGCVSQSTITVVNASLEGRKRNAFLLSAESHHKYLVMMSPLSHCIAVLLSIISVYYAQSCCTDHCLWRNHNYRGICQKKFKDVWDNMRWLRQVISRLYPITHFLHLWVTKKNAKILGFIVPVCFSPVIHWRKQASRSVPVWVPESQWWVVWLCENVTRRLSSLGRVFLSPCLDTQQTSGG